MEIIIDWMHVLTILIVVGFWLFVLIDWMIIQIAVMMTCSEGHDSGWKSNKLMVIGNIQAVIIGTLLCFSIFIWIIFLIINGLFISTGAITIT